MAALDLPSPNYLLPPADPDVANAQAQSRQLVAQQAATQRNQVELQRQQMDAQQQQRTALGQTMASDVSQWTQNPIYQKAWQDQPAEFKQHILNAYQPIANEAPQVTNAAARAATGNPDIGVPPVPSGSPMTETIAPDGKVHRSFQTTAGADQLPSGELPADQENIAKAIAARQFNLTALPRQPQQRMQILSRVTQLDPNFDEKLYPVQQAVEKSFTSGPDANNKTSANTLMGHIAELYDAGKQLNNGGVPVWNKLTNAYEQHIAGNPAQTRFLSASNAVADEMAKLFKGTGAASDSSIKDWKATISSDMSPEQLKSAVATGLNLMQSRLDALGDKYESAMGKPLDRPILNPRSQAIIRNLQREGLPVGDSSQPQELSPTAPASAPAQPPAINSQAEYDKLPSGTRYTDSHGKTATKK